MKTFVIGSTLVGHEHSDYMKQSLVLRDAMTRIGRALIRAGHDLVVCSPFADSADFEAVRGASEVLPGRPGPNIQSYTPNLEAARAQLDELLLTLPRDRVNIFYQPISADEQGKPQLTYTWLLSQLPALEQSKVVLALGGKLDGPASLILPIAESRRRDILPLSFLGGAALKCFERRQYELMDRFGDKVASLQDPTRVEEAVGLIGELATSPTFKPPPAATIRVFLSYPTARPLEADIIEMLLRRRDCEVYRDEENFGAGNSITAEIRNHLHQATVFVAVWCKEYACSPWCFDELELAISRHKEGKLELWILCVDETRIVPPAARELNAFHTHTRAELETVLLKLLRKIEEGAT